MSTATSTSAATGADGADGDDRPAGRGHAGLRSFVRFMWTFRGRMALIGGVFVVANGCLAVIPLFIGEFVAVLATDPVPRGAAYGWAAALIACTIGHDLTWRAGDLLYMRLLLGRTFEYENILFQRVIEGEYPYFAGRSTGKIGSYLRTLGQEFRVFLDNVYFAYLEQIIKLPAIVLIMFSVNLPTGLAFTVAIALLALVGRRTARLSARAEGRAADVSADMDSYVFDVVANFVAVKSFRRERAEQAEVRRRRRHVTVAAKKSMFAGIVFWASMSAVVRWLVWPGTILLNLHLFLRGDLSLGELATFLSALVIFSEFIWAVLWQASQAVLQFARVEEAYAYLFGSRDILAPAPAADTEPPAARPLAAIPAQPAIALDDAAPAALTSLGRLELRDITFAYPDNPTASVLDGVSLTISRHEKIGIVGHSGSGKTTLIKLLLGYYQLPLGAVAVDGRPVPNRWLAQVISYVPQDITLFQRSIMENITYGAPEGISEEDVRQAARQAHAQEFIDRASRGYDTLVGERGIRLSTGQRQRIAIARAFLDHKPLLILDEATSALDSESELLVQQALEELWRDRTVIAIAHRLSTLLRMDRIVVLDAGRVVEQGSHHELLDRRGHYYRLWQRQSGEMLVAD